MNSENNKVKQLNIISFVDSYIINQNISDTYNPLS